VWMGELFPFPCVCVACGERREGDGSSTWAVTEVRIGSGKLLNSLIKLMRVKRGRRGQKKKQNTSVVEAEETPVQEIESEELVKHSYNYQQEVVPTDVRQYFMNVEKLLGTSLPILVSSRVNASKPL
jgi:hypothetical protein